MLARVQWSRLDLRGGLAGESVTLPVVDLLFADPVAQFALTDALELGDRVIRVVHDWGSALGFDWARIHSNRVQGIAHLEAVATSMEWSHFPDDAREMFQGFRSWPNQTEVTVSGEHYVQEDSPDEIGLAVADFVRGLR